VRLEGDLRADNLSVNGRLIGDARGTSAISSPRFEIDQLSLKQGQATLTGNVAFNQNTSSLKFSARVSAVDIQTFRDFGIPDSLRGVTSRASSGRRDHSPSNVRGEANDPEPGIYSEVFPQARVVLSSTGRDLIFAWMLGETSTCLRRSIRLRRFILSPPERLSTSTH